ncbi:hypothetical protein ACFW2Y_27675 [Streptomyces sp. NPDC058877]|uniref:hypothetical protein n=1 Tax=unclassified Streptomyces TaxID=2593676 RepID=UPI0036B67A77
MATQNLPGQSIRDFATWQPVLRLLRAAKAGKAGAEPMRVASRIGRSGRSLSLPRPVPAPGRALRIEDMQDELDAVERVRTAMTEVGVDDVSFSAKIEPTGTAAPRRRAMYGTFRLDTDKRLNLTPIADTFPRRFGAAGTGRGRQ